MNDQNKNPFEPPDTEPVFLYRPKREHFIPIFLSWLSHLVFFILSIVLIALTMETFVGFGFLAIIPLCIIIAAINRVLLPTNTTVFGIESLNHFTYSLVYAILSILLVAMYAILFMISILLLALATEACNQIAGIAIDQSVPPIGSVWLAGGICFSIYYRSVKEIPDHRPNKKSKFIL